MKLRDFLLFYIGDYSDLAFFYNDTDRTSPKFYYKDISESMKDDYIVSAIWIDTYFHFGFAKNYICVEIERI